MARSKVLERPFTISDAMILVAASAVGLAWGGGVYRSSLREGTAPFGGKPWGERFLLAVLILVIPCLIAWTPAALLLRLRSPRASWTWMGRQPGLAASLSALIGITLAGLLSVAVMVRLILRRGASWPTFEEWAASWLEFFWIASPLVGACVLVAWLLQAIQRRWRAEPSWIDRGGRALGVLWITVSSIVAVYMLIELI